MQGDWLAARKASDIAVTTPDNLRRATSSPLKIPSKHQPFILYLHRLADSVRILTFLCQRFQSVLVFPERPGAQLCRGNHIMSSTLVRTVRDPCERTCDARVHNTSPSQSFDGKIDPESDAKIMERSVKRADKAVFLSVTRNSVPLTPSLNDLIIWVWVDVRFPQLAGRLAHRIKNSSLPS